MVVNNDKYKKVKQWRDNHIGNHLSSNNELNQFHHKIMNKVLEIAIDELKGKFGDPPSEFTWFVMGSGGRLEQAIVSDQDHGLVYERNDDRSKTYFQALGKEITKGLYLTGYPYCEGNVMCSNPLWCRSMEEWKAQISEWMEEKSWESIRYILIFYDARPLIGSDQFIRGLKQVIYQYLKEYPYFLNRLLKNTMRIQKGIGFFGQFLTETHGTHTGSINIKNYGFFPYVNVVRFLSIKENLHVTSTLSRFEQLSQLSSYKQELNRHQINFKRLLDYRLRNSQQNDNYEDIHYLNIQKMTGKQRTELKQILREATLFQQSIQNSILKGS